MTADVGTRRAVFRKLHEEGSLILLNPWDLGSLRRIEALGAKAIATSSAGFAESRGRADYQMTRDEVLAHLEEICAATELPVNADYESGFADTNRELSESVSLAVDAGVAGLSLEDRHGAALYPKDVAVDRVRTARKAIDDTGHDVMLVARCEGFLTGTAAIEEVVDRIRAYSGAGADVLYAPGGNSPDEIRSIVEAVAPKPVNVLLFPGMQVQDIFAMGVCRVSTGSFLAGAAWQGLESTAKAVLQQGHY